MRAQYGRVCGFEPIGRHVQLACRLEYQDLASLCCGMAQRSAAVLKRMTSGRVTLVGRPFGVGRYEFESVERDFELLRHHLRQRGLQDRKSTRLNSSHDQISYAVFCLKKKKTNSHKSTGKVMRRPSNWTSHSRPRHSVRVGCSPRPRPDAQ